MNKDLDERMVPTGEYRDALNIEVSTSEGSDVGALQTLMGNTLLSNLDPNNIEDFTCIGSIVDGKNDVIYWMVAGNNKDMIVEFDYKTDTISPVVVDEFTAQGERALNFNRDFLITGINVVEDFLFWTDNNSEPKKVNIPLAKSGTQSGFNVHTNFMIRDMSVNAVPNSYVQATDVDGVVIPIQEKHLTVIKKGPSAPPVLEMIDTALGDWDGDGVVGGEEISASVGNASSIQWLNDDGEIDSGATITISTPSGTDFVSNSNSWGTMYVNIYVRGDRSINARVELLSGGGFGYTGKILSGNPAISGQEDLIIELEEEPNLFEFKFPRFAYRYKYDDGEYSPYSPFTQPAFLPGRFDYMPKQGYNLGMVNRLRRLAIKDFVHERSMPEDVVSIDILYKESNSPNVYSVKTIKRRDYNPDKWDEWNAVGRNNVTSGPNQVFNGWNDRTEGYLPITSEIIHATLPSNQLLRPWDNVPRKALAQEVIGSRLVYGNYLQNYNLKNIAKGNSNIKVDLKVQIRSKDIGSEYPKEIEAGPNRLPLRYNPAKSLKSLRTYQLGVVYIDQYGRETPVFSEDKIGKTGNSERHTASVFNKKLNADKRTSLTVELKNDPPDWATHFKLFVKETSNEYYNLAMDRWYDAEDGNVWISFPSAERNKVDEDTFLILKKTHDEDTFVSDPARYKIIAIENEAPRFIKLQNISMGGLTDDGNTPGLLGIAGSGFPLEGGFFIMVEAQAFKDAGWEATLVNQDISQVYFRVKSVSGVSNYYRLKQVSFDPSGFYKIESSKVFGPDMAHTSPDNTYLNRIKNCELQIIKRIPEDKAEFEGRFFVKILKDGTLINNLGVTTGNTSDYIPVASMQVQYIAPKDAWSSSGQANWYGCDRRRISVDEANDGGGGFTWCRPDQADNGQGNKYWKMAGDDEASGSMSDSSGWFIDKVEGFRPFKHNWHFYRNNDGGGYYQKPAYLSNLSLGQTTCNALSWAWGYDMSDHADKNTLQACGTGTYAVSQGTGASGINNYLDDSSMKGPGNKVWTAGKGDGGEVGPSMGINKDLNVIHLSYAGLNESSGGNGDWGTGKWNSQWADWVFKPGAKHVADILFIEKLTLPDSIWKWKEDPGKVMYKTVMASSNPNITLSSIYNTDHLNSETSDLDGNEGVYLFNHAYFRDYTIWVHHTRDVDGTSFVTGVFNCWEHDKVDFVSRNIPTHTVVSNSQCILLAAFSGCSFYNHLSDDSAGDCGVYGGQWGQHKRWPTSIYSHKNSFNRRRRYIIVAETFHADHLVNSLPVGVGQVPPHNYLPTNNPDFDSHFDHTATVITEYPTGHPQAGTTFPDPAPGIRTDGMYSGYDDPNPYPFDKGDGNGTVTVEHIPQYKRWDANYTTTNGASPPRQSNVPGSVTWEILEFFTSEPEKFTSTNPAIFETEPKEDVGLDIYHEAGHIYPIHLNDETIEQFVGAIHKDTSKNSYVRCWDPDPPIGQGLKDVLMSTGTNEDIRVYAADGRFVQLADRNGVVLDANNPLHSVPDITNGGAYLIFYRADGGTTEAHIGTASYNNNGTWFELVGNHFNNDVGVHNKMIELPWFNCYSFGNGVESDRIRDDYNQVTIDNGPKASTTIEEPYLEDRRKHGFIWSGIYNSRSGVNNLNQFIQAEAITKDVNPGYGSIQKMHARDNDLVAFCEDRVLKVYANKDALFNADGNTNVVATNKVLGAVKPFVGDYGISKNPESFASDSYRSYFSDTSRGAIVRLSQDGLTPISDFGMKDWFSDNLPNYDRIIGSFDTSKDEYNITLVSIANNTIPGGPLSSMGSGTGPATTTTQGPVGPTMMASPMSMAVPPPMSGGSNGGYDYVSIDKTLSFSEPINGWVSFKSWIQENGVSLNNNYYTFKIGELYHHHTNEIRNNFYEEQFDSSVDILFNQAPGIIKSYSTLNYEGTQSRITRDINNNPDYYDNFAKSGWYIQELTSDVQELGELEFWDKEDKWFSQIKGVKTEWLNDGTAGNIDPREFSYQGIGNAGQITCPDCPEVVSWICQQNQPGTTFCPDCTASTVAQHANGGPYIHYNLAAATAAGNPALQNPSYLNYLWLETAAQGIPGGYWSGHPSSGYIGGDGNPYFGNSKYINMDTPASLPAGYAPCFLNGIDNSNGHCVETKGVSIESMDPDGSGPMARFFAVDFAFLMQYILMDPIGVNLTTSSGQSIEDAFVAGNLVWHMEYDANGNSIFPPNVEALEDILNNAGINTYGGNQHTLRALVNTGAPTFSCQQISGTSGYATQQECIDSGCGQPAESWTCDPVTKSCVDPGDGSGAYPTFCDCVNAPCCPEGEAYFFTCNNLPIPSQVVYGCMDDGITADPWIIANRPSSWIGSASNYNPQANVDDCDCFYQGTSSWDCDGQGNCFDPGTGLGQYATLAICQQNCPVPCPSDPLTQSVAITPATGGTGGCPNHLNDGTVQIHITAVQAPLISSTFLWATQLSDSSGNMIHSSGPHTGLTNTPVFSGLSPDTYTYRIIDLNTNCDWTYTAIVACQDPPPPVSFTCDPQNGGCFDPGNGSGQYATLAQCQAAPGCEPQGCTDPCACNYDPLAVVDDGSCIYDCPTLPIMDTSWINYLDPNSTLCQADPNCYGVSSAASPTLVASLSSNCDFPNNEFAIQTLIANPNIGVHYDMRQLKWYRYSSCSTYYHSLRVRQVDLDNWYQFGPGYYFFTWADYIDAAIATGIVPPLQLLDPSKIGQDGCDHTNGYLLDFSDVNDVITSAFENECNANPGGQACHNSSGTITRCEHFHPNDAIDCDKTYSAPCVPCANSTAIQPCTPPPPPPANNYECIGNNCMPTSAPIGGNVYNTLQDCFNSGCGGITTGEYPLSYDCNPITGTCYDPGTGLGQFSTLSACQANCEIVTPATNYICEQGVYTCNPTLQPVGGNVYATLADCQANCVPISPNDIAWAGCCHPLAMEYNFIGYNGLPCHADSMCTCHMDPFYCTLPSCFVAGTEVTMLDGFSKNIENIVIGDIVRSYNEYTNEISDATVIKTQSQTTSKTVKLNFNNIEVQSTFDHPYYVENKGWSIYDPESSSHGFAINKLEIGDICYIHNNGNIDKVKLTNTEEIIENVTTYIFTLDRDKTFFANNILVHNKQ